MRRMVLLVMIIAAFPLHAGAQIRTDRIANIPVLNMPAGIQVPRQIFIFPENDSRTTSDQRQNSFYRPVAMDAATQHLPFFCRQELKAEKRLGVPLRLRLGSVQYTDWLEQKPGAVAPR